MNFIRPIVRFFERWMPDSFAVAIGLTFLTFVLAITLTDMTPMGAVDAWGDGFWKLLAFTNQIALTLLLGYAMASTAPVRRLLVHAADIVRSPRAAYMIVCALTGVLALLSWSLALVAAGITCRAVAEAARRRGIAVHYPLLVASAFAGFVVWHQGLTGSIELTIATPGHFLESAIGVIPTSQTLFTTWNLVTALAVLVTLPVVMAMMHPRSDDEIETAPDELFRQPDDEVETAETDAGEITPAVRFERSRLLALCAVALGGVYLYSHYIQRGNGLTLNIMNFTLLMIGILFSGHLQRYGRHLMAGGHIAVPFLIQYPFYAGIAGMIATSGLGSMVVKLFVSVSDPAHLQLFGFLSAAVLNIFIPSGGAQWAVQGPIMMEAAKTLGAEPSLIAMSVAFGDQWTNLIQPLILLPVLTLARADARAIMGYLFIALLWSGAIFVTALSLA